MHTEAAFEGGKWGDCLRPRSWGGPALQAKTSTFRVHLKLSKLLCVFMLF